MLLLFPFPKPLLTFTLPTALSFALPIVQALLSDPHPLFGIVLAPTRELAFQIHEHFEAIGTGFSFFSFPFFPLIFFHSFFLSFFFSCFFFSFFLLSSFFFLFFIFFSLFILPPLSGIGLKSVVVVGGIDTMTQAIALAKKPHVVIATPGRFFPLSPSLPFSPSPLSPLPSLLSSRYCCHYSHCHRYLFRLVWHLQQTKGFTLRNIKFLVMDEAGFFLLLFFPFSFFFSFFLFLSFVLTSFPDRLLNMDFEEEINTILKVPPLFPLLLLSFFFPLISPFLSFSFFSS